MSDTQEKNHLFVLCTNRSHLEQIEQALHSFYQISIFRVADDLLTQLQSSMPSALLIDDKLENGSSPECIETIRASSNFNILPIVYTVQSGLGVALSHTFADIQVLEKPYRRTALLNAISSQVNSSVEKKWDNVEPIQQAALKNTLSTFNNIADLISEGKPIVYETVKADCEHLVEAVKNNNYQNMLKGVRGHDNYSYVHSMRVATLLSVFGASIGIKGDDHMTLTSGGLLHDIGKMEIPFEILNKPGRLNDEEFEIMKKHVSYTHDYMEISSPPLPKGIRIIADQHHERLDGTGYPNGIAGKGLNQLARMAAIIDVFSALTDRRVYKPPMSAENALSIMGDMKGHLDLNLMSLFREILLDTIGELSTAGE